MEINNIGIQESIFNHFIQEIRDVNTQLDSMRFRRNLERIGEVFAYEISKVLDYKKEEIKTSSWNFSRKLNQRKTSISYNFKSRSSFASGIVKLF